jgi:hypothetical protein
VIVSTVNSALAFGNYVADPIPVIEPRISSSKKPTLACNLKTWNYRSDTISAVSDTMEDQETYQSIDTSSSHARDAASPEKQDPTSMFDVTRVSSIDPPPNGGWEAWSQVLGGHIVTFFVWGFITSFGMFQAYYTATGVSSSSNLSWIGSLMIFFLMLIPIWSGSAADVGHFKLVLRMGILLWVVGIFATSVCRKYWQFLLVQGLCIGVANGLMFVPTMSVVSTYFDPSRRSLAIGLILCGSATGGMIFLIILNRLFSIVGFGWAVRTFGFMALVLLLLAERSLKKRLPPKDSMKLFEPSELKDIVFVLFLSKALQYTRKVPANNPRSSALSSTSVVCTLPSSTSTHMRAIS